MTTRDNTEKDLETLQGIVRRATSPMWWARLSYPTNSDFWTENEQRVLSNTGLTGRKSH